MPLTVESVLIGLILMLISGSMLLYAYALASTIDPSLAGWDWWQAVLLTIMAHGGWLQIVVFLLGMFLLARGTRGLIADNR